MVTRNNIATKNASRQACYMLKALYRLWKRKPILRFSKPRTRTKMKYTYYFSLHLINQIKQARLSKSSQMPQIWSIRALIRRLRMIRLMRAKPRGFPLETKDRILPWRHIDICAKNVEVSKLGNWRCEANKIPSKRDTKIFVECVPALWRGLLFQLPCTFSTI